MSGKNFSATSFIRLNDETVLPVSTVLYVQGNKIQEEHHILAEEWEKMVQEMMERAGRVMSDYIGTQHLEGEKKSENETLF
ncbi:hypothetical protein [Negativibacillus massiliensis]|uniref:hypothetical protein n=1 Tax=Negativibacillus massiliensis TaxID=1871035 RepID=UPI00033EE4C6|nr:hypothetical protein [Negativibacillus massiliensis]CDA78850.1 unknown [Clostridium sp. CAG:242]